MNKFDLEQMGLQEMTAEEINEVEGGAIGLFIAGLIILGAMCYYSLE